MSSGFFIERLMIRMSLTSGRERKEESKKAIRSSAHPPNGSVSPKKNCWMLRMICFNGLYSLNSVTGKLFTESRL